MMNVYDFDGTIYNGDSSIDFFLFCLRRRPQIVKYLPMQVWGAVLYLLKRISTTRFKEYFFSFLRGLPDVDRELFLFWRGRGGKIMAWYTACRSEEDVVISASPEFLLKPVCEILGIMPPIATLMDSVTGRIEGQNCKGEEKVRRFLEQYPQGGIRRFYSDSLTDAPLAAMAEEAFLIKKGAPSLWPER